MIPLGVDWYAKLVAATKVIALLLGLSILAGVIERHPVMAQANPAVTACGLPASGNIFSSVTYTMSADCELTGRLSIASATPVLSVTINGGGFTITGPADSFVFGPGTTLTLNNVTVDGGFQSATTLQAGTLHATNKTLTGSSSGPVIAGSTRFTNVLLNQNYSGAFSLGGNGSAVHAASGTTHEWNNVVLRNSYYGGAAISLLGTATLTTSGCLTLSGNVPYDIYDAGSGWTDNSTGRCSGTIGNGDRAAIPVPALMGCGLPGAGNWDRSATYRLSADCELNGAVTISEDVDIRIVGNGRTISTSSTNFTFFTAATSSLRLENVGLDGVRTINFGDFRADRLRGTGSSNQMILNDGEVRIVNSLFENNVAPSGTRPSVLATWNPYEKGYVSFRDTAFRNNHGGPAAIRNANATVELLGCIIFENNTPANTTGTITDNSETGCATIIVDPLVLIEYSPDSPTGDTSGRQIDLSTCDIKLGAIGLICRPREQPPWAGVYRIDDESVGTFVLAVRQQQVEDMDAGLVACSVDGRVAVRVGLTDAVRRLIVHSERYETPRPPTARDILFSKGPNFEGKVRHVVINHALDGHVLGTVDTYDGLPCQPASAAVSNLPTSSSSSRAQTVQRQTPQADGSIAHVIQPGDTVYMIALAYGVQPATVLSLNDLSDGGHLIVAGQTLLIPASG